MIYLELSSFSLAGQGMAFWSAVAFLFGILMGSFFNVVIYRLPRMQAGRNAQSERYSSLSKRSSCPHCGHAIRWYENIPLVSYAVLRGRCSDCKSPISWRYPFVELASGVIAATPLLLIGPTWHTAALVAIGWSLLVAECVAGERERVETQRASRLDHG